jgi:hypothetical protein
VVLSVMSDVALLACGMQWYSRGMVCMWSESGLKV